MFRHQLHKTLIVFLLNQMQQFMDDDILYAGHGLLDQFQVEQDPTGLLIASTPARLHSLDTP